jgi:glycosyltransferase involved in cell wall biosynthesis
MAMNSKLAVLIPCYNEEQTIGKVLQDFRAVLPEAELIVFDNCCTDNTAATARTHGATVVKEPRKGKGFVVESMLRRVEADYYVMVDGDDTYPAEKVHELLAPLLVGEADMVVGARLAAYTDKSFRPLHVMGNNVVRWAINVIFDAHLSDVLSGFRAFNRRVCQCIPAVSSGFEIETELTIQMLYYNLSIREVQIPYRERPDGSESKLNTVRDGWRVVWKVFSLFRAFKPLSFFGGFGMLFFLMGGMAGIPPVYGFVESGYTEVRRFPLAILATGLMILAFSSMFLGIMLHSVNYRVRELHNIVTRREWR